MLVGFLKRITYWRQRIHEGIGVHVIHVCFMTAFPVFSVHILNWYHKNGSGQTEYGFILPRLISFTTKFFIYTCCRNLKSIKFDASTNAVIDYKTDTLCEGEKPNSESHRASRNRQNALTIECIS